MGSLLTHVPGRVPYDLNIHAHRNVWLRYLLEGIDIVMAAGSTVEPTGETMQIRSHGDFTTGFARHPLVVTALLDAVETFLVQPPVFNRPIIPAPPTVNDAVGVLRNPTDGTIGRWIRDSSNMASALAFNADRYKHAIELVSQQPDVVMALIRDANAVWTISLAVGIATRLAEVGRETPPIAITYPSPVALAAAREVLTRIRRNVESAMAAGCHMMHSSELFVALAQYT